MKFRLSAFLLATAAMLVSSSAMTPVWAQADSKEEKSAPAPVKDYTIIKVGGDEMKASEVQETWKSLFPGGNPPDFNTFDENVRQNVLRGLISERLIYQEAVKSGIDKSEDVQKRLEALKKQVVMQAFIEQKAKTLVSDQDLRAAYDQKVAANKGQEEIRARHILVASEDDAKAIAKELKNGGDFEKLAKEKSTDKGTGAKGGELGWFTKDKMVPEFGDAAYKLKKGEVSDPVKTPFGWHVIQVEDRRPIQMPGFDEMKDSLKAELANKAVQTYVEGLLKKADIKYYGPDGKEKPFSRELTAPKDKKAAKKE